MGRGKDTYGNESSEGGGLLSLGEFRRVAAANGGVLDGRLFDLTAANRCRFQGQEKETQLRTRNVELLVNSWNYKLTRIIINTRTRRTTMVRLETSTIGREV